MINDLWYKNAVIYCLSVGTYMDANGDGIGDFPIARKHRHATYAVYPRRARTPCCGLRTFGNSANDRLFYEAILRPLLNDFGGREPGLG